MKANSGNDPEIPNPIFESDDKKLPTVSHNTVLEPVVVDESTCINNPTMR